MLRDIACPSCDSMALAARPTDGRPACQSCGQLYAADKIVCYKCEALNAASASFCSECGESLRNRCPGCNAENWTGAATCTRCGHDLDLVQSMARRHALGFKGTLQEQRDSAAALKAGEERDSRDRLAAMWEIERKRQANLARDQARQHAQQNWMLVTILIFGALALLALILVVVYASH